MRIAALILAAGSSQRMGKAKQLLPYKHTTLLGWAIENVLKTEIDSVYCVLGANADKISSTISDFDINIVYNSEYKNGLSSSITKGIEHIKTKDYDSVLIMLCDQPQVNNFYLNALISEFKSNPKSIIASNYINKNGVPAIFPKKLFDQLLKLKNDTGAKSLLNNNKELVETIKNGINLFDIDTPEDYKKLINKI